MENTIMQNNARDGHETKTEGSGGGESLTQRVIGAGLVAETSPHLQEIAAEAIVQVYGMEDMSEDAVNDMIELLVNVKKLEQWQP